VVKNSMKRIKNKSSHIKYKMPLGVLFKYDKSTPSGVVMTHKYDERNPAQASAEKGKNRPPILPKKRCRIGQSKLSNIQAQIQCDLAWNCSECRWYR
jgi:hypothetical protein